MNNNFFSKISLGGVRTLLVLLLSVCSAQFLYAYDFEKDGIYYNITSSSDNTVSVTYGYNNSYSGEVTIPETVENDGVIYSVTSIGDKAFGNCGGLTKVIIGNSVTSIGDEAFLYCGRLTELTIGNSVTSIGSSAFYFCSGLTKLTIPNSVISIGYNAFGACSGLTELIIPNSVTSIGSSAFYQCSRLTDVTIGNSVTSIGSSAFENCGNLTDLTIGNSVTSIGERAFDYCISLTKLTIPNSVTSIGERAFYNCRGLTNLTIPNSVTSIGYYAFYFCSGLTDLTFSDGSTLLSVSTSAFSNCPIKTVHWGRNIDNSIFRGSTSLKTLVIGYRVISIGDEAFQGCNNLTDLTISNGVTSIGNRAFSGCSSLVKIFSCIKKPFVITNVFDETTYSTATLYVLKGKKEIYQNTDGWNFYNIDDDTSLELASVAAYATYQNALDVYDQYLYYYSGDGMESYKQSYNQIVESQNENEGKASGILNEIDELIKKVTESAMTDEEKASYLKTLEELKTSVSALEAENKDILSKNTFFTDVQGHYAEVTAYHDGFASYEQRIEEATTSADLLEIIAEMEKATENVKTTCLAPVVDEYGKLEAISDRIAAISEELEVKTTELQDCSKKVDATIAEVLEKHRAEAGAAYKEAQSIYEQYLYYYSGEGMESYKQIVDAQTENEGKASGILNEIDELIKKVTESAMTDDEKASYLKTLEELKTSVSDLEAENKDILSDNTFFADVQGHYDDVAAYHDGFASYEQRIKNATTSAELLVIIAEMEKATEKVETTCLAPVVDEYEKLAEIADRIAAISKELEAKTTELQACSDDVDATIAEVFEKHRAEADAAYKEVQSIYEQYLYYYSGEGMESYKQIVDAQTENEGKASDILNEIDELIEKVKASAMTDDEKASYLKMLEELKTSVSDLEAENKDILSDNTFLTEVQGHYDEVAAYHDGFADYEQRIKEATTSADLLVIIEQMKAATEEVEKSCLSPVVDEYEKLAAIANSIAAISEELKAMTTELQACSDDVDATIAKVFEKHRAEADAAYKEAQSIYEQYLYYYSGEGMKSYKLIEDAQTENEGKASGILSEIDELIKKVKESAMTDDEKASYLKMLEELKTSVSDLEKENKDILSDNTFYADVQGHYAEVAALLDYEQRIKEATTSAGLLAIIEQMKAATEKVEKSCLSPVVSEYEKLVAISDELDKISEQLDAYATQLESVSGEVNDILTGIVNSVYGAADEIMVYTLSGMGQKMKKSDLRSLPKGIYIINGRKYVVK